MYAGWPAGAVKSRLDTVSQLRPLAETSTRTADAAVPMVIPAPLSCAARPRSTTADDPASVGHHSVEALPSISFAADPGWTLPPSARLTASPLARADAGAASTTAAARTHNFRCRKAPPVNSSDTCESVR